MGQQKLEDKKLQVFEQPTNRIPTVIAATTITGRRCTTPSKLFRADIDIFRITGAYLICQSKL